MKISKALGVKDLGSPGCSEGEREKKVSDPNALEIFLDLAPILFITSAALVPISPLSILSLKSLLLLPLGEPRHDSLYVVVGGAGVMLSSALGFLFWMKVALHSSWLACQLGNSAPV